MRAFNRTALVVMKGRIGTCMTVPLNTKVYDF